MADCHLGRQVHVTVDAQKLAMGVFKFHCLVLFRARSEVNTDSIHARNLQEAKLTSIISKST